MRNSHFHDFRGPDWIRLKQYARRPPTICWAPFIIYLRFKRLANSRAYIPDSQSLPISHTSSLFFSSIPHCRQDNECWLTNRLKKAQESSNYKQPGKIGAGSGAGQHRTPTHNIETEIFRDWHPRNDVVLRIFDNKYRDKNASCQPVILCFPN